MIKPASLRAAIAAAVPDLQANPDKFVVFADAGALAAAGTGSLSFEYRYTLNLLLTDFSGDPDTVMVPLLAWVDLNQPDLLKSPDKRASAITFEVDYLNNTTYDLSIKLPLAEAVVVTMGADGKPVIKHKEEPVPEWKTAGLGG